MIFLLYFRDNSERLKKLAKSPGCLENGNHPEGNFCNFTEFLFFGKFHLLCSKQFEMFNSNRDLLSLKSNRGYNYYDEKNCAFCLMHRDVSSLQCSTDYICFSGKFNYFQRNFLKKIFFFFTFRTRKCRGRWLLFGS